MKIRVRYNLFVSCLMLALGFGALGAGIVLDETFSIGLGAIHALVGIAYLLQPWFVVYGDRVEIRTLIGTGAGVHTFGSLAELELRDGKLYRRGERTALRGVGGFLARSSDMRAVGAAIAEAGELAGA